MAHIEGPEAACVTSWSAGSCCRACHRDARVCVNEARDSPPGRVTQPRVTTETAAGALRR